MKTIGRRFFFVSTRRAFDLPEVQELWRGYPGNFEEQQIDLASLRILGRERPIPLEDWSREIKTVKEADQPAEIASDVTAMRKWGPLDFAISKRRTTATWATQGLCSTVVLT